MDCGNPRGPVERVVEGRAVEDEEAPERLLHLGVRPVGDEALLVADADGRGARRRRELLAADEDPPRPAQRRRTRRTARTRRRARRPSSSPRRSGRRGSGQRTPCDTSGSWMSPVSDRRRSGTGGIDSGHSASLIRSSRVSAAALSRSSLRFPHFGLCTQDGQPDRHGQRPSRRAVSATHSRSSRSRALRCRRLPHALRRRTRREARLLVDVRREAADVPAVAHRDSGSSEMSACSARGEPRRGSASCRFREQLRPGREPDALGLVRPSRAGRAASCRSRLPSRSPSLEADDLLETSMRRGGASTPATCRCRSASTIEVSVSFRGCVYQSTATGRTSAVRVSRSRR
jgi:hypothetical protein